MISSLCEAYHWTVEEAFKLTTPQIVLLCHASSEHAKKLKSKYSDNKYDHSNSNNKSDRLVDRKGMDPVIWKGKTLSEVTNSTDWENTLIPYLSGLTNINAL